MKMKTKDIVVIVISFLLIGTSVYFMLKILSPKKPVDTTQTTEIKEIEEVKIISGGIDEKALEKVDSLTDYGKPELQGIGKTDLFSPVK